MTSSLSSTIDWLNDPTSLDERLMQIADATTRHAGGYAQAADGMTMWLTASIAADIDPENLLDNDMLNRIQAEILELKRSCTVGPLLTPAVRIVLSRIPGTER